MDAVEQMTFLHIFLWIETFCILIQISLKFVTKALGQVMAWYRVGNNPLSEPTSPNIILEQLFWHTIIVRSLNPFEDRVHVDFSFRNIDWIREDFVSSLVEKRFLGCLQDNLSVLCVDPPQEGKISSILSTLVTPPQLPSMKHRVALVAVTTTSYLSSWAVHYQW